VSLSPTAALTRLYAATEVEPDWFAPSFLDAVPIARVREVHTSVVERGGGFLRVREVHEGLYEVAFERATFDSTIALDLDGRITGIRTSGANEDRWQRLARDCVRGSWRHMATGSMICAAIVLWYGVRGASMSRIAFVVAFAMLVVGYDLGRIFAARRALRDPSRLRSFSLGQRRSHLARGRIFMIAMPAILIVTWTGVAFERGRLPADAWIVLAGTTLFLALGWRAWRRGLARMHATPPHLR
jgi:hypothetical protein